MSRSTLNQLVRYGLVGGFNTLLTFVAYALLVYAGMAYLLANLLAWLFGIVCAYFMHLLFVFGERTDLPKAQTRQFLKFGVLYGGSFTLNMLALYALVESGLLGPVTAQFIVIPFIVAVNFVSSKFLVFKPTAR